MSDSTARNVGASHSRQGSRPNFVLPRVKVCGLKRVEDARAALAAGADALGVVHYASSPRSAELNEAREIFELDTSVPGVLVVVEPTPQQASAWMTACGAAAIQLCGSQRAEDWSGFEFPILRRLGVDASAVQELDAWRDVAAGFVLDHPSSAGGSGQTVDFALAAELAKSAPCLLAGGLDAENVEMALEAVPAFGVDASSRLESLPGRKNPAAVLAFVRAAHACFASRSASQNGER